MYVTEDTVRTDPDTVERLYSAAIRSGARAIVLCDTVGHATPEGAYNLGLADNYLARLENIPRGLYPDQVAQQLGRDVKLALTKFLSRL